MNTMIFGILLAAVLAIMPSAVNGQEPGGSAENDDPSMFAMGGHGMGGGCGMEHGGMGVPGSHGRGRGMAMAGLGEFRQLDLSADQRVKINRIDLDLRKQLWALKGRTFDSQAQLSELYSAEKPDAKKIGAVYSALFDVRRQMIEAQIEASNRAREILTKEQLEKLRQKQPVAAMGSGPRH